MQMLNIFKSSEVIARWWSNNIVNVLNATGLYALKWLIHVMWISPQFKKNIATAK